VTFEDHIELLLDEALQRPSPRAIRWRSWSRQNAGAPASNPMRRAKPMSLLDPRFRYVPSVETDVTATWRRFGFDSRRNEDRRARLGQRIADQYSKCGSQK
jgi:hypothetical protein